MQVYVDITEPGAVFHTIHRRGQEEGIDVERTVLHKREGKGGSMRADHPFYGMGADFVVADDKDLPLVGIERKTMEGLARSISLDEEEDGAPKIFRQLGDLMVHPTRLLMLEGRPSSLYRRVEPAILGLQFWCARQGVAIVTTTSPTASGNAVFLIARRLKEELEDPVEEEWDPPDREALQDLGSRGEARGREDDRG